MPAETSILKLPTWVLAILLVGAPSVSGVVSYASTSIAQASQPTVKGNTVNTDLILYRISLLEEQLKELKNFIREIEKTLEECK